MAVDDETLERARDADPAAIEAVMNDCFPAVHRLAHALTGEPGIAQRIVRYVLRRSASVMPRWRAGLMPENWFYHHTLMATRAATTRPPAADRDLLVIAGPSTDPAYSAFVRALRTLPAQQMEAFIVHHGEKFNDRLLAISMDLSTQAAGAHLAAATAALRTISGDQYVAMVAALERAYASLTPPETIIHSASRKEIRSLFWGNLLRRLIRMAVALLVAAAIAYAVWRWRFQLLQWFDAVKSRAQTQRA